jgi:gamma-glutamylputrescine oxidase
MLSYWEQSSLIAYDYIIIGGGFVGMHTALALKQKFPKANIAILERGLLPTGASTRNAGFACTGSASELVDDLENMKVADLLNLFAMRKNGLAYTRKLLGDATIDYRKEGAYELLNKHTLSVLNRLDELNKLLAPLNGVITFSENKRIISENNFNKNVFKAAINNQCEGSLDTGLLVKALLQLTAELGIKIITGAQVTNIEESDKEVKVYCTNLQEQMSFTCNRLVYCTNAFTKQFLPELNLEPGRGIVLVTKPIQNLHIKGIYHFEEGYYYFRNVANRILFGGGRNLDKQTEATSDMQINESILADLKEKLKQDILPYTPHEIDYSWSGIMAFGDTKAPIIKALSPRSYCAVRCGGMGVAIAPMVAMEVAGLVE